MPESNSVVRIAPCVAYMDARPMEMPRIIVTMMIASSPVWNAGKTTAPNTVKTPAPQSQIRRRPSLSPRYPASGTVPIANAEAIRFASRPNHAGYPRVPVR